MTSAAGAAPLLVTAFAGGGIGSAVALWYGNRRSRARHDGGTTADPGAAHPGAPRPEPAPDAAHHATRDAAAATFAAVQVLAATSAQQAAAMNSLAQMTAHSMRSATGTYVFQLRDRFDEALPVVAIGVADHSWRALAADDTRDDAATGPTDEQIDAAALELVDQLVYHPGDRVRFVARFVVNQSPIRRTMTLTVTGAPEEAVVHPARCRSASRSGAAAAFDVAPDVSTFVELPIDVEVGSLPHGSFALLVEGRFEVTNTRPEGSIAHLPFRVLVRGVVVPDDDGNGLDLVSVEAEVDPDRRTYWLDKAERVELTLPGPAPATPAPVPVAIAPTATATPTPTAAPTATASDAASHAAKHEDPGMARVP